MNRMVGAFVFGALAACTSPNPDHCGRNGPGYCADRHAGFEYCSICATERDGCVAEPVVDPNCVPVMSPSTGDPTEQPGTTGSDSGTTASSSTTADPTTADPTTADPTTVTTVDPTTGTSENTDPTTGPTTGPTSDPTTGTGTGTDTGARCGNGAVDPGENCDGMDLDGQSCVNWGYGGGTLACDEMCQFDITGCCHIEGEDCNTLDSECCGDLTCQLLTNECVP